MAHHRWETLLSTWQWRTPELHNCHTMREIVRTEPSQLGVEEGRLAGAAQGRTDTGTQAHAKTGREGGATIVDHARGCHRQQRGGEARWWALEVARVCAPGVAQELHMKHRGKTLSRLSHASAKRSNKSAINIFKTHRVRYYRMDSFQYNGTCVIYYKHFI